MKCIKLLFRTLLLFLVQVGFSQNVVTYSNLSQTVTAQPGQEVSVKVMASCTGGSSASVLISPTYCVFDNGITSINFSNGNYLLPGQQSEITFKFKKIVTTDQTFTYKFSTNSSCNQPDSKMIVITVNYKKGTPPPPPTENCVLPGLSNIKESNITHNSVLLTWDKLAGARGYEVLYYDKALGKPIVKVTSDTPSIQIQSLNASKTYSFFIYSLCSSGLPGSAGGGYLDVTTAPCPTLPSSVENISIIPSSYGYKVDFKPIVDTQYNLEYVDLDTNSSGVVAPFSLLPAGATYPNFYYIPTGHSFKIRVMAYSDCASTYSNWITVNGSCPSAPAGLYVYNNSFKWDLVANSQNYQGEYLIYNLARQNVSGVFNSGTNTYSTSINTNGISGNKFVKFRMKSLCSNGSWSDFSDWSNITVWNN